ncbi:D-alanyl-D-alanine carboxypeptidase/D-alanyl-D-alanine-endopeptidase [Legionella londiniensis]|uniref:D-alanyl-D-alanine carboxypeptidase n=1 Tax=Legionella londiniensis TaxID=45068 RepID=A0A0W0VQY7_9GAMM|nr:D-alanyl-D-alanine carboxypeptidase/D-alanyl-D-alanine-endopeptidase [Legionella londiniensis]KTD22545.1 D-alanyl-D-alanine carboxypeptidase [Legionella londiniensis]STX92476.1 D-alanyl-D-alanine carboxypeptidase [Legionella londiniensis]
MQRIWLGLLLFLVSVKLCLAGNIQKVIDKLINQVDPNINIGVDIVDLRTGENLYHRNPQRAYIPASNMKLFSEAAALMVLGPDYRFKNHLSTNAAVIENGVLKGSLYLHLPGDPSLKHDHIYSMLEQLNHWGIKSIEGNVVLVSANRFINAYAPGWMVEDLKYSYGAPLAPVILDENRLTVIINPTHQAGKPALVELKDQNTSLFVNNQVKTKKKSGSCGIDYHMSHDNRLTVRGCIGLGQWAVQQGIAIRNPLLYAQEIIKLQLAKLRIKLNGEVVLGSSPKKTMLLATHQSKPVSQLLADALKPSDNLYADSLYLHAAAKLHGGPANWEHAKTSIKQFLQQQTGIDLGSAVLNDGSGLSRYDQLTPQQTVELLQFLHERFPLAYEFIAALPIAGYDGTLQKRFRKPKQQGLLRAKTGTMTGVVSLSGYLYTANAHILAFAIYINGTPGSRSAGAGRYRYLIDAVCDYFLTYKPQHRAVNMPQNPHGRVAFQNRPTQAELQRDKYMRWRRMESAMKKELAGQAVSVLFRDNQLALLDDNADPNLVWAKLIQLNQKYPFAVALQGEQPPRQVSSAPLFLWQKGKSAEARRTWIIHEVLTF